MVSERKLQANSRNAKRSSGPKDTRRTRFNAQKHGLLSQAAIIQAGDAKEDPRELESLLEALWEDLKPEGALEEFLVDRIASCQWRLRRAQRAETGEIRRSADSAVIEVIDSTVDQYDLAVQKEAMSFVPGSSGTARELARTTLGIARIKSILDSMRDGMEDEGTLAMEQLQQAFDIYGRRKGSFAADLMLASISTGGLQSNDEEPDAGRDRRSSEKCKGALLALIDTELARLKIEAELVVEREKLEWDAAVLARHLPGEEILEKILRYEAAIDRQMYRALKELRELQAARRGRSTVLGASENGV